jgi:alanyl-tRNA synthetase
VTGPVVKPLKGREVRAAFLKFFEGRGHTVYPSDSLVPTNDPSLLFSGAGMNQFKDSFLGHGNLPFKRAATSQKCVRTGDIDNVGRTPAHHTFFEMLGNFSFGDYFKREAIEWAWEWVTTVIGLPEEKLLVSIYEDDREAYDIWQDVIGLPKGKVHRFGEHENFWPTDAPSQAPLGTLCGPCSEIFYDWGEGSGTSPCDVPECDPSCSCGRFVEIWNLVFQQFEKGDAPGKLSPLAMKNIDTGAGLERLAAVLQGVHSNFDTDLFRPLVKQAADASGRRYREDAEADSALRRIADHARAVTFMIGDGVLPSNEGRGYVVRRLLRRAVLDGRRLGVDGAFLFSMIPTVADLMGDQYPEVRDRRDRIAGFVRGEEERFGETLAAGLQQLERFSSGLARGATLDGKSVFTLYDTYGFPVELTEEILAERGVKVDRGGFAVQMSAARERSRGGLVEDIFGYAFLNEVKVRTKATAFVGHDSTEADATVIALVRGERETGKVVGALSESDALCQIVLDRTPFYGEAGGQVGDSGVVETASGAVFGVEDTRRAGDIFLHRGRVLKGELSTGEAVHASVSRDRRLDIARNHTATHILHNKLRAVLGPHVEQAGSLVAAESLRLDFSHGQAMTREELNEVEARVNARILEDSPVGVKETSVEDARAEGAMALFGEKYGDRVHMVSVGDFSKELCGGTHLRRTGEIGLFRIVSEESVAAGVRRITALTGRGAYESVKAVESVLAELSRELRAPVTEIPARVRSISGRVKKLERELKAARRKTLAGSGVDGLLERSQTVEGVVVLAANLGEAHPDDLRSAGDVLRPKLLDANPDGAVLCLGGASESKVSLVCWVMPKALAKRGVKAGAIVKRIAPVVGGGGGGRDDMAQAGGKDAARIDEALSQVAGLVREALGG